MTASDRFLRPCVHAFLVVLTAMVVIGTPHAAQKDKGKPKPIEKRHGVLPDIDNYPQGTPKDVLASVVRAIDKQRVDYLLAHLTDPEFVDRLVAQSKSDFDAVVKETRDHLNANPGEIQELRRFLREGKIDEEGDRATIRHPDIKTRMIFLRKLDNRWFMENRKDPPK